jgi:lycopene cyclase domain-containing protein
MKYLYLYIDIFSVVFPLLFSFHPRIKFYKNWKAFFPALFMTALLFIIWDELFTRNGIWGFNPKYVMGIYVFHLPIEEILFFLCIPYCCIFTHQCITTFYPIHWKRDLTNTAVVIISVVLLITGTLFFTRLYTSFTFISLALILLLANFILKIKWLGKLFWVYGLLLIPFFVVNGVLTGTGLQEPVVWYDLHQTLGIRIMTIPVEDIFYGFELIFINMLFFEYFKTNLTRMHIPYRKYNL